MCVSVLCDCEVLPVLALLFCWPVCFLVTTFEQCKKFTLKRLQYEPADAQTQQVSAIALSAFVSRALTKVAHFVMIN